ncbi:hypothetical protein ACLOJK_023221 [Asimina triloba]
MDEAADGGDEDGSWATADHERMAVKMDRRRLVSKGEMLLVAGAVTTRSNLGGQCRISLLAMPPCSLSIVAMGEGESDAVHRYRPNGPTPLSAFCPSPPAHRHSWKNAAAWI